MDGTGLPFLYTFGQEGTKHFELNNMRTIFVNLKNLLTINNLHVRSETA